MTGTADGGIGDLSGQGLAFCFFSAQGIRFFWSWRVGFVMRAKGNTNG